MYDAFISYRRGKGSTLASFFDSEINKMGFNCFLDVEQNRTGEFMKYVEVSIKQSNLFLLIVTEGSIERFKNEDDISRKELEWAIKYNVPILPISAIEEKIFDDFKINNLPDFVKDLSKLNIRMYKHEMRNDILLFLSELLKELRVKKFNEVAKNAYEVDKSKHQEGNLFKYVEHVEDKFLKLNGKELKYSGGLKFGNPSGEGTLVDLSNGYIYQAEWNPYFKFSGKGTVSFQGDIVYEGEFLELLYHGEGYFKAKGFTYKGEFLEGKIRGSGVMIKDNGDVLTGDWLSGLLYQNGHIRFSNGDEYSGALNENIPNGYGILIDSKGHKFDGYFRNGKLQEGAMITDTIVYIGSFTNSVPDGRGCLYTDKFELIFEGIFRDGVTIGSGTFYMLGKEISDYILTEEVKNRIKEFYDNFDDMQVKVKGELSNNRFMLQQEFSVVEISTLQPICTGYIESYEEAKVTFKVHKDYSVVYDSRPQF